jgi:D-alanyl-D-alanine carboxypeptidase
MKYRLLAVLMLSCILISTTTAQAQEVSSDLQAVLADWVEADDPAVVIQVTTPDGSWTAARGRVNTANDTAASPQDRFRIGSMSKTFVATVTLQLAAEGVFSLDDPVRNWLPPEVVANVANADRVTLRQLLSMRSGIDDYLATDEFWEAVDEDTTHDWTALEAISYAYDWPPLFAPDEAFNYSNSNYILLQLILEAATGEKLSTLVRSRILTPLRMKNTYTQIEEAIPGGFVHGYEDYDGDGVLDDVTDINDGAGLGDGALVSTTGDLTIFYRALLQDQTLLDRESMAELLAFRDDQDTPGERYSMGLGESDTDWGAAVGHTGAVLGFVSSGAYFPDEDAIVIVLCASADADAWGITEDALAVMLDDA